MILADIYSNNTIHLKIKIAQKLKALRKKKSLTQAVVADALHMSQNAYSLLEAGKTKIDVERLYQIAAFYEVSVYDILDDSPPPANRENKVRL